MWNSAGILCQRSVMVFQVGSFGVWWWWGGDGSCAPFQPWPRYLKVSDIISMPLNQLSDWLPHTTSQLGGGGWHGRQLPSVLQRRVTPVLSQPILSMCGSSYLNYFKWHPHSRGSWGANELMLQWIGSCSHLCWWGKLWHTMSLFTSAISLRWKQKT